MSASKKLFILKVEAKDTFQLAKHLLSISKLINDGYHEGFEPCNWDVIERRQAP